MKNNLVIISAGKLGREVFGWATQVIDCGMPWRIKGFLDDRSNALDGFAYDSKIIGSVFDYDIQEGDIFIGAIGDPLDKREYYMPVLKRGGRFTNLIHPSAVIGNNVRLGDGVIMAPFTCTTSDVSIGSFVTVLPFSNIAHDAVIGDWCQICGHCGINGNVTVGEEVFLGSHSCVVPKRRIGTGAYVGAGSVVVRDIPEGSRVFGNPANLIRAFKDTGKQTPIRNSTQEA